MRFGSETTTYPLDNKGSTIATVKKVRNGETEKVIKHYRIKVHVRNSQEEMMEFMRFTEELSRCRKNGTLTHDKEDTSTRPAFIIEYPRYDVDGSYFVTKNYCVVDIH